MCVSLLSAINGPRWDSGVCWGSDIVRSIYRKHANKHATIQFLKLLKRKRERGGKRDRDRGGREGRERETETERDRETEEGGRGERERERKTEEGGRGERERKTEEGGRGER